MEQSWGLKAVPMSSQARKQLRRTFSPSTGTERRGTEGGSYDRLSLGRLVPVVTRKSGRTSASRLPQIEQT